MQLHYNILWIDNDLPEYIERGQINKLKDFILELGFEPNVITFFEDTGLDDALEKIKFDLIISDYNLDNTTGDIIIERIREKNILTEILFYTAGTKDFKNVTAVVDRLKFVDRISFQYGRDNLISKIESLIKLTLDKLLDLNATRGIITAETSSLDVLVNDLTITLVNEKLKKSKEDLDKIIQYYQSDFLEKGVSKFKERYNEIGFEKMFGSLEANRKWGIFRDLLKEYNKTAKDQAIADFLAGNKTYFSQIIDIRNKFAHAKSEELEDGRTVLKGQYGKEDFQFDDNACIEIRKNIIEHKRNFNLVAAHL